jgi:hypothetical protein
MCTSLRTCAVLLASAVTLTAGVARAGLTPIQTWAPPSALEFKTATVCHFAPTDYYGVFAVFQVRSLGGIPVDELWYLKVDGLSSWWQYGQIVVATRIARETVISRVDCTTDGNRTAYVAWDRSDDPLDTLGAKWARVDINGAVGLTVDVPKCDSRAACAPGIAYHDGGIAVSSAGRSACSACSFVWPDATDPATYERFLIWLDGQTAFATDVIWNGEGSYLHAALVRMDGTGKPNLILTQIGPDGSYVDHHAISEVAWTASNYSGVYLALSDHALNPNGAVLVQTDRRTFWSDRWGAPVGPSRIVGPLANFPTCEYWGSEARIAHTFTWGVGGTIHWEWPPASGAPLSIHPVDTEVKLSPRACGSSAGFADAELLLVRKGLASTYTPESLHLNLEPQE